MDGGFQAVRAVGEIFDDLVESTLLAGGKS
jgi:hypothetical protein